MAKHLVIVESPAKAKTINRYLGSDYQVKASMGHVRDLPRKKLGVSIEDNFSPEYNPIPERKKVIAELQHLAKKVQSVLLAADPDREGEAICWHLSELLKTSNPNISRVMFNEITKKAVLNGLDGAAPLDENKINAQQSRRILDRLVGYLISPLLWKKVGKGLSAGRVQSIALRLICEREKEIKAFTSEEYWTISALLRASSPPDFKAALVKIDGQKAKVDDETRAREIEAEAKSLPFVLHDIAVKERRRTPPPPYMTSTLQQDGFRLRRFSVKKTMLVAQKLYEGQEIGEKGLVGLITYMRTDSVRVSDEALQSARRLIGERFGDRYLPSQPRQFANKSKAQDAHEAIRPTSFDLPPDAVQPYLKRDEHALYTMIWNRFIASQMSQAVIEETQFDIRAGVYQFQAKGEVIRFDGFLALNPAPKKDKEEDVLPQAQTGETLQLLDIETKQNFTQPPARFTEGSLVKELEKRGIGRPSTYAPIISTLQDRVYVVKEEGKFIPTDLGLFVTDYLILNFHELMEFEFTAKLEEELDLISEGKKPWQEYLKSYYVILEEDLRKAMQSESVKPKGIPSADICPQCGRPLVIKEGRFGRFKACSGYPDCTFKQSLVKKESQPLEETCPECGSQLILRSGRYGPFIACSNYPRCKYIKKDAQDTKIACPLGCGGTLVRKKSRKGRVFFGCSSYPSCRYATWNEPLPRHCPQCGKPLLKKNSSGGASVLCSAEECGYQEAETPDEKSSP